MEKSSTTNGLALPGKHQLTKEVSIVLAIKLLLLFLIWACCFSHPPAKYVDDQAFVNHLLSHSTTQQRKR